MHSPRSPSSSIWSHYTTPDEYCILCGAPLTRPTWDPEEEEGTYSKDVLVGPQDPELDWLRQAHSIRENLRPVSYYSEYSPMPPETGSPVAATADPEFSATLIEEQDHHNVSAPMEDSKDEERYIPVIELFQGLDSPYSWSSPNSLRIPFHDSCLKILCRYINVSVANLNTTSFFDALKRFAPDEDTWRPYVDFGDIRHAMGHTWQSRRGEEHFLFDPFHIKELRDFYQQLSRHDTSNKKKGSRVFMTQGDPFSILSQEVLLLVMSHLDVPTIFTLRQTSPGCANVELRFSFWRDHIKTDMPWLFDLPASALAQIGDLDWEQAYRALYWGGNCSEEGDPRKIHGLYNRRRIWEQMCPQFALFYEENEYRRTVLGSSIAETVDNAPHVGIRQLVKPGTDYLQTWTETLLDRYSDYEDIEHLHLSLQFEWIELGYLVGIHILKNGKRDLFNKMPKPPSVAHVDKVDIPNDDWLIGLIFTSRVVNPNDPLSEQQRQVVGISVLFGTHPTVELGEMEGDKRLMRSNSQLHVVGLKMRCFPNGTLCKCTLLQQFWSNVPGNCSRVRQPNDATYYSWHSDELWAKCLPKPDRKFSSTFSSGSITLERPHLDVEPIDVLTFAFVKEELDDVVSISIADGIGGIKVDYGHMESRAVGPIRENWKTLRIDGQGGERIAKIKVLRPDLRMVSITTNWGNKLKVGKLLPPSMSSEEAYWSEVYVLGGYQLIPCGFYGIWVGHDLRGLGLEGAEEIGHQPEEWYQIR